MRFAFVTAFIAAALVAGSAGAQSSSLYAVETPNVPIRADGVPVNPHMANSSYLFVAIPEPRTYEVHDLITIVVRESASATLESEMETEKEVGVNGEITSFPLLDITDLIDSGLNNATNPQVGVTYSSEFSGEADYERKDETVFRITARVVDVKPNGTLVLEARKGITHDDENMTITLTGYCRTEDIAADNTVLSTQMFDLRLNKQHSGQLRKSSQKGLFTEAIDLFLNF